eukprot:765489-Hanusia_phi.AAC.8
MSRVSHLPADRPRHGESVVDGDYNVVDIDSCCSSTCRINQNPKRVTHLTLLVLSSLASHRPAPPDLLVLFLLRRSSHHPALLKPERIEDCMLREAVSSRQLPGRRGPVRCSNARQQMFLLCFQANCLTLQSTFLETMSPSSSLPLRPSQKAPPNAHHRQAASRYACSLHIGWAVLGGGELSKPNPGQVPVGDKQIGMEVQASGVRDAGEGEGGRGREREGNRRSTLIQLEGARKHGDGS